MFSFVANDTIPNCHVRRTREDAIQGRMRNMACLRCVAGVRLDGARSGSDPCSASQRIRDGGLRGGPTSPALSILQSNQFVIKRIGRSEIGVRGFEPPTPSSRTMCATRLRYTPTSPRRAASAAIYGRPSPRKRSLVRRVPLRECKEDRGADSRPVWLGHGGYGGGRCRSKRFARPGASPASERATVRRTRSSCCDDRN